MLRRTATLLTVLAALGGSAACGGQNAGSGDRGEASAGNPEVGDQASQGAESIPASDVERIIQAEDSVNTACGLVENQAGSDVPLPRAISILQSAYRESHEGTYAAPDDDEQRNMEQVVETNVRTLRDCGKTAEASELESVLKS